MSETRFRTRSPFASSITSVTYPGWSSVKFTAIGGCGPAAPPGPAPAPAAAANFAASWLPSGAIALTSPTHTRAPSFVKLARVGVSLSSEAFVIRNRIARVVTFFPKSSQSSPSEIRSWLVMLTGFTICCQLPSGASSGFPFAAAFNVSTSPASKPAEATASPRSVTGLAQVNITHAG